MVNSIKKGKKGELDFCRFVKDLGHDCRRSQQYKGSKDSADVDSDLFWFIHPEVKRVEKLNFYEAYSQADADSGDEKEPVVFHRKNRGEWMAFCDAKFFLELLETYNKYVKGGIPWYAQSSKEDIA